MQGKLYFASQLHFLKIKLPCQATAKLLMTQLVSCGALKLFVLNFIFAVAWTDYDPINGSYFVTRQKPTSCERITIKDNPYHDGNRNLFLTLSNEYGEDVWVEICIWDDEWGMLQ